MHHISKEAIDKFSEIYERKFGKPIAREDATIMALRLINMYRLFRRPLPPSLDKKADALHHERAKEESGPSVP